MLVFLAEHMDANRLSALFASLSSKESQVYYTIGKVVVATLTVPAGLSLIYTTEIHSGSKTLITILGLTLKQWTINLDIIFTETMCV